MAIFYSDLRTNDRASPPVKNDVTVHGARRRYVVATYTVPSSGQPTIGDDIELFYLERGARIVPGSKFFYSASTGATIAVGDAASSGRYLAATSIGTAGSALMEAHLANGAVYEEPAGAMVMARVAGATLTAGAVLSFHFSYTKD